jgi:hypothetical protein
LAFDPTTEYDVGVIQTVDVLFIGMISNYLSEEGLRLTYGVAGVMVWMKKLEQSAMWDAWTSAA